MVFEWAHWLKAEKKKAITRTRSGSLQKTASAPLPAHHKYSFHSLHDTLQHALGYGSWWSVLLVFILVVLGCIGWLNAWLVEKLANFLRRFGILPQIIDTEDTVESLLQAASEGDIKTVTKLVALSSGNKAILEAQSSCNNLGDTVIHMAARFGYSNIVIALLDAGVDIEVRNRIGETPLAVAAESGRVSVVAVLLSRGADEEACVVDTSLKPLHLAAMFGHTEVARLLISRRPSSLNYQETSHLNTPLHLAVGLSHPNMVSFLLEQKNIDLTLRDVNGKTAAQLAADDPEMSAIFKEHAMKS